MRNKLGQAIKTLELVMVALLLLNGCQLAIPEGDSDGKDHLIGAFITTKYIGNVEQEISSQLKNKGITAANNQEEIILTEKDLDKSKIYASQNEKNHFSFENIEGSYVLYHQQVGKDYRNILNSSGQEISDVYVENKGTDTEDKIKIDATIYVVAKDYLSFYINPVYQTAKGEIYAIASDSGVTFSGDNTSSGFSSQYRDEWKIKKNNNLKKEQSEVSIHIECKDQPGKVAIYQMDQEMKKTKEDEYDPKDLPEKIVVEKNTESIIVEQENQKISGDSQGQQKTFQIYGKDEKQIKVFAELENGFLHKKEIEIKWKNEK